MPRELEGSLDVDKSMPPKAQNHLGSRSRFKSSHGATNPLRPKRLGNK
jgi:hypothetical protein